MRRITIWITATIALIALLIAFQLNATGSGGKTGENDQRPATEQTGKPGEHK